MGPQCCCCKTTVTANEQRKWMEEGGGTSSVYVKSTPDDPADPRQIEFGLDLRPAATAAYAIGTMAPDWKNKRIYFSYIDDPNGFMGTPSTVVKWWNAKSNINGSGGTHVKTMGGFWLDSMAADPDNEHIYYVGNDDPYPDYSANVAVDLKRMDYDGSNVTTLDTIDVFRTGGTIMSKGVGSLLVHRKEQRLYYVKRHNIGTSTASDWQIDICYRDFADMTTEVSIYNVVCFSTLSAATAIRLINCLSFDVEDEKIYWCEHYQNSGFLGNVQRANLDGTGVELLYASASPYAVNFARFSNSKKKIFHEDFDSNPTPPRDGFYVREKDWTLIEQLGIDGLPETNGSPFPEPGSSYLWCGYESTGSGVKP